MASKEQHANEAPETQYSSLSRFIFQSAHYRIAAPASPKPNAFLPAPEAMKTSAIWRDLLDPDEIWGIGDVLGQLRGKPPIARADFELGAVLEASLFIESDPAPHPRHLNLCGWPTDKAEQKSVALILCKRSTLVER